MPGVINAPRGPFWGQSSWGRQCGHPLARPRRRVVARLLAGRWPPPRPGTLELAGRGALGEGLSPESIQPSRGGLSMFLTSLDSRERQKPEKYSKSTCWDDVLGARQVLKKYLSGIIVDEIFWVSGKVKKYLKSTQTSAHDMRLGTVGPHGAHWAPWGPMGPHGPHQPLPEPPPCCLGSRYYGNNRCQGETPM